MAQVHWTKQVSADFNTTGDWSTKSVPGAKDDAILDAAGSTAYTVTASTNETVSSIQTNATATLAIDSGTTFTATAGTGSGGNAGTIVIEDGATFAIGGAFANTGFIDLQSVGTGNPTNLVIAKSTTLSGGGSVVLSDVPYNAILGGASNTTLTNVDNTISGAGTIGSATLTLLNQAAGVIDATGGAALTLNTGAHTITNGGTLEATGSGGMTIESAVANTGGTLLATAGSSILFQGAAVSGGVVNTVGSGAIISNGATFDGTVNSLTNEGIVQVNDGQSLTIQGAIVNEGGMFLDSVGTGNPTSLIVGKNTTLTGAGFVTLSDSPYNQIAGGASNTTLTNVDNGIVGAGTIGSGTLTLVNQASGSIEATRTNALVLNTGAHTITNAGFIVTTNSGGLVLQSGMANTGTLEALGTGAFTIAGATVNNTGGKIEAEAGGHLSLQTGAISGGLVIIDAGALLTADARVSTLSAATFTNAGTVAVEDGASLGVTGSIGNTGTISLASVGTGNPTDLVITGSTTLAGGGSVILSDVPYNAILGGAASATLTNVDNTIGGAGTIGSATLTLINQASGVIDATGASALTLATGAQAITNAGTLEATGSGGLVLLSNVANAGGAILAAAGDAVTLQGVTVFGGTLAGAGQFVAQGATLDGVTSTLVDKAQILVADGQNLNLQGAIANSGAISIQSVGTGNPTGLTVTGNTTLSGAGHIALSDLPYNQIVGGASAVTLTNLDNTIAGSGVIGGSTLTLVNGVAGLIEATGANALTLGVGSNTIANGGTIENAGAGGLVIQDAIVNTGTLLAHAGTLTLVGALASLSGTTLNTGTYEADAGATLELTQNAKIVTTKGAIVLNGAGSTIEAFNTTSGTEVAVDSTLATIAATGALEVLGGRNWNTKAAMTNAGLIQLGGGTFTASSLTSSGTLSGFGLVKTLVANTGAISVDAGKTLTLQGGLSSLSGSTLTAGPYTVGAGGTLQLADNTTISTLSALVDLAGVGATIQSLNTGASQEVGLEATLTAITKNGALEVLGGRNFTATNAIANGGTIQLGGGTLSGGALTDAAGAKLTGFGAVASVFSDSAGDTITSAGGALAFSGAGDIFAANLAGTEIDFTGGTDLLQSGAALTSKAVGVSGGAVVTVSSSQSLTKLVEGAGSIQLGGATLALNGAGSSVAGTIGGTAGSALVFAGGTQAINTGAAINVSSWSLTGGAATLNEALGFSGAFSEATSAVLTIAATEKLTLTGVDAFSGTVNGAGTVKISNATATALTIGGTATFNDAGVVTQSGAVTLGDATSGAAVLSVNTGATWTLDGDVGIALGHSKKSTIKNSGALIKSAGSGISIIAPKVSDTGSIVAASGTLDFAGALSGAGSLTVDTGAVLELDNKVASTLTVSFSGASKLSLGKVKNFAATLDGFAAGDTIDLLATKATSATLGAGDTLVIKNGAQHVATLQLTGDYAGDTFTVASDGAGGTDITLAAGGSAARPAPPTPPRVAPFASAVAGFAARAAGDHFTAGAAQDGPRMRLAVPRPQMA